MSLILTSVRDQLLHHPIYASVDTIPKLRSFMADHVFAVWDFMSLLKRLQLDLTGVGLPWRPPADSQAARFVNDIVLAEESDEGPDGCPASHLEIYLRAMDEIGADTTPFRQFLGRLNDGCQPAEALETAGVNLHTRRFVLDTLDIAQTGTVEEVAAAFLHGREDVIPDMFARILPQWRGQAPCFRYYLERHIELDGDHHGPAGHALLNRLLDGDPVRAQSAEIAAVRAVRSRIHFWDGVLERIQQQEVAVVG